MAGLIDKIEINCDMGEGFGRWTMGPDKELMLYIDAANIACGFHAGDPSIMLKTVQLAKVYGVRTGAHPGIDDKFGFGRRQMLIHPDDMYASILYQVGALKAMLDAEGLPLSHIKPHGELYFYMQRDEGIMRAVLRACSKFEGVPVYACKNEMQAHICREMEIPFQEEVYVDIDYSPEGKLVSVAASKLAAVEDIRRRVKQAAEDDMREHQGGGMFNLDFGEMPCSICLHSDMPTALENSRVARKAVDEANVKRGFKVKSLKTAEG